MIIAAESRENHGNGTYEDGVEKFKILTPYLGLFTAGFASIEHVDTYGNVITFDAMRIARKLSDQFEETVRTDTWNFLRSYDSLATIRLESVGLYVDFQKLASLVGATSGNFLTVGFIVVGEEGVVHLYSIAFRSELTPKNEIEVRSHIEHDASALPGHEDIKGFGFLKVIRGVLTGQAEYLKYRSRPEWVKALARDFSDPVWLANELVKFGVETAPEYKAPYLGGPIFVYRADRTGICRLQ